MPIRAITRRDRQLSGTVNDTISFNCSASNPNFNAALAPSVCEAEGARASAAAEAAPAAVDGLAVHGDLHGHGLGA